MPRDRVTKTEMARRAFFEVATWKARATLTSRSTLLSARSKLLKSFLDRPSPRPRKEARRNKVAVDAACDLLAWWGHKVVATRNGCPKS